MDLHYIVLKRRKRSFMKPFREHKNYNMNPSMYYKLEMHVRMSVIPIVAAILLSQAMFKFYASIRVRWHNQEVGRGASSKSIRGAKLAKYYPKNSANKCGQRFKVTMELLLSCHTSFFGADQATSNAWVAK